MTLYRDIHGPTLYDEEAAREFVFALSHEERERLLVELHKFTGAQSSGKCVCVCVCMCVCVCVCVCVCICACVCVCVCAVVCVVVRLCVWLCVHSCCMC